MEYSEIRRASNAKLLRLLKEDLDDDLYDTIAYELFEYREAGKGEDIYKWKLTKLEQVESYMISMKLKQIVKKKLSSLRYVVMTK